MKRAACAVVFAAAIAGLLLFSLAPFLWSVLTSLKPEREVFAVPPTWLPSRIALESYAGVFEQRPFALYFANSLLVAALSTLLALSAAAPAAYALARFRLRGAGPIEQTFLLFALFPSAVLLVPLYSMVRDLGVANSRLALAAVHAALNLPFAVWTLTSFFRELPVEIEDAARVDGFSRLQLLARIVLPLSAPALGATSILLFIFSWNEFVLALAFLTRDDLRTVPLGISMLTGVSVYEVPWGRISAAVVLTTLPVVAAVLGFQRWIVSGLTAGAVKG
ncbi:MAG: carbohydrate ABC transporter permease [Planctomycetes bacterium]|nr:carbohydrate ABC transporter permease [Planctomycetota bacterium]